MQYRHRTRQHIASRIYHITYILLPADRRCIDLSEAVGSGPLPTVHSSLRRMPYRKSTLAHTQRPRQSAIHRLDCGRRMRPSDPTAQILSHPFPSAVGNRNDIRPAPHVLPDAIQRFNRSHPFTRPASTIHNLSHRPSQISIRIIKRLAPMAPPRRNIAIRLQPSNLITHLTVHMKLLAPISLRSIAPPDSQSSK